MFVMIWQNLKVVKMFLKHISPSLTKSSERTTPLKLNLRPKHKLLRMKKLRMQLPKLKHQQRETKRNKRKRRLKKSLLQFNSEEELDRLWIIFKFLIKNAEEMRLFLRLN